MAPATFTAHVRAHLPVLGLDPHREEEIVEELAQQLESTYDAARAAGAGDEGAERVAYGLVGDWVALGREIVAAERSRVVRAARRAAAPLILEPEGDGMIVTAVRQVGQDLRHGLRQLRGHPGFTAAALLMLALTVGASSAIFSLVNAVLLAPLPFADPAALVAVEEGMPEVGFGAVPFSPPDLRDYAAAQQSLSALAAYRNGSVEMANGQESERVDITKVSPSLFAVLGVQPALGRAFGADDAAPGAAVAILSHAVWTRRFARDAAVIGRTVLLDRQPFVVVGVLPERAVFPMAGGRFNSRPAQVFVPLSFTDEELQARGGFFASSVVGRLKPGVTPASAQAEAATLASRIYAQYPAEFKAAVKDAQLRLGVTPLHEHVSGSSRTVVLVLFGAVLLLLLAGCANVGSLLLALTTSRQRELAVRASLGAGRARLAGQLLTESVLLASLGGILGLGLAWALIRLAPRALPASTPRLEALGIDAGVVAFAGLATLATAILFGAAPAWRWSGVTPASAMASTASRGATSGGARARRSLAVLQCAFAVLLLVPAGLLGRTMWTLLSREPGFATERVLTLSTYLPAGGYGTDGLRMAAFYAEARERLAAVPGVGHAGVSMDRPLAPEEHRGVVVEGDDVAAASAPIVAYTWVTPGYLEALSVPLLRGRGILASDGPDAPPVVLVSTSAAQQFWPGDDPVGKRLRNSLEAPWAVVAGVVGDVRESGLDKEPGPHVYAPVAQVSGEVLGENIVGLFRTPRVAVATSGTPAAVGSFVREALRSIDPQLALTPVTTLRETVTETLGMPRLASAVVGAFSLAALLIAALGLNGVLAFGVAQRRREFGIRLALGATPRGVLGLVAWDGLLLVALGVAAGLVAAYGVTGLLRGMLVGVGPADPVTFAAVAAIVMLAAMAAVWMPARTATRIDPASTIRDA